MIQAKSFAVYGITSTRDRLKITSLPVEIDKALNPVLEELGDSVKTVVVSQLGGALPDAVLVTVLYEGEAAKKKK